MFLGVPGNYLKKKQQKNQKNSTKEIELIKMNVADNSRAECH